MAGLLSVLAVGLAFDDDDDEEGALVPSGCLWGAPLLPALVAEDVAVATAALVRALLIGLAFVTGSCGKATAAIVPPEGPPGY